MKRISTLFGLMLLFILLSGAAIAQRITVKGKLSDATTHETLIGVSVVEQGTTNGVTTDANGAYSITVPSDATLSFTYIGYTPQLAAVKGQATVNIDLQPSDKELQAVVVVGYGTQKKRDLTGSIAVVKGDDIAKLPNTNPIASLQGLVSGLTVVNSGRAGASPTVRIRGVNSTNNADPLYVVDGLFQTNIDYLNPGDIESIEVLKDPSSIAIFGLQGGNGVIVVTTKRAPKGQTRVSFQTSWGIQHVPNKISVVDADGFKKLYSAQLSNLGAAPFDYTNYTANTNWQNLILRNAPININSLTVSNTSDKSTTLVSVGYNTQDGVLRNDSYQKYIARLNEEIRVTDNIKIGGDVNAYYWKQNPSGADLNNALWAAPIVPVQVDNNTYYSMPSFQRAQVSNPIATLNRNDGNTINQGTRVVGSLYGEVKFLKDFTFRSSFQADVSYNTTRGYTPLPYAFVNLGEGAAKTYTSIDQTVRTSVSQSQAEYRKYQQDHTLTYDKTINKSHHITALVGFTTLYTGNSNINGNRKDTTLNIPNDPNLWYLGIASQANPGTYGGGASEVASMSYLSRVNYSYQGKYLVNASYRRDGSSLYGANRHWGNFGSVGLGWVISDENFFKDVKGINFLKMRGSWGTVGNGLGTSPYQANPVLVTSGVGVFGDNVYPSVTPKYVADPNLHWESVRGIDVGLEARILNNRLSVDLGVYDKKTYDILTHVQLLASTGSNTDYFTNLGTIDNRGVEVSLSWTDHIGAFTYRISPNFSYDKNKVVSIGNSTNFQILGNGGVNLTESGQSIGYFYGYKQVGIYQTTAALDKMPHFSNSLPGDIAYADINGDGKIDSKDRTYLGTPFPAYNYGINIALGYKGFDLNLQGQGVAGNKIYTQRRTSTFAVLNYETNRLNAWTSAGSTNVEPILDNTRGNNFLFSNYYLESGDYFRVRNVQLGYTFNPKLTDALGIKQLRVYVSGQNIKTFTKATGYTPEVAISNPIAAGADNGTYPVPAVYTVGLNVTF